ncbi:unnamed protein product [Dicrocoelium dendriticum]|nr:unnamed protein product [Dicrocoelium dendriticum]
MWGKLLYKTYGLNTALRLLHLVRLRKINWRKLYRMEMTTDQYLDERPGNFLQGITNTILSKRVLFYYPLPCEWNVQAQKSEGLKSCPVYWIERTASLNNCNSNATKKRNRKDLKLALVLQYRRQKKTNFTIIDALDDADDEQASVERKDRQMKKNHNGQVTHKSKGPLAAITRSKRLNSSTCIREIKHGIDLFVVP